VGNAQMPHNKVAQTLATLCLIWFYEAKCTNKAKMWFGKDSFVACIES